MDPCQAALSIVKELREAGFQAYLVGGCVRDRLLGKEPEDYDVCTDARPDQVEALFPRTIATGIRHGTVTVIAAGHPVEVTTFRVEGAYRDGRRPDHVRFVGRVEEDLARRDFTINAMAQDPEGAIIDPFGGRRDLERRVIRTVGAAEDRFREDALRMVRAVRLAAQLEFSLHPETEAAIRRMAPDLARLSVERVTQELEKVWKARRPSRAVASLFRLGMMEHLPLPPLGPALLPPSARPGRPGRGRIPPDALGAFAPSVRAKAGGGGRAAEGTASSEAGCGGNRPVVSLRRRLAFLPRGGGGKAENLP